MPTVDDILDHSFEDDWKGIEDQFDELEAEGYGQRKTKTYIKCTSHCDNDYEIAQAVGCKDLVDISDCNSDTVVCDCGREIHLDQKKTRKTYQFDTNINRIRDTLRDRLKQITGDSSVRQKSLKYIGYNFDKLVLHANLDFLKSGEHITSQIYIHLCTRRIPNVVVETIKLYGGQSFFVLIGEGTSNKTQFRDLNLPFIEFSDLFGVSDEEFDKKIWPLIEKARQTDSLTDLDRRAEIATNLYKKHRIEQDGIDPINEDVFEYIVDTLLNYCFKTSHLFGTTMSGQELPDGTLCLQTPKGVDTYLWDAKYSEPSNEPHDLPAAEQRNMTKYPKIIYENSGMDEKHSDIQKFEAFLFVTPRLNTNHLKNFAIKLDETYSGDTVIDSTVTHLRMDALIAFYEAIRDNTHGTRRVENVTHKQFNSLLKEDAHHKRETEFIEYNKRHHADQNPETWPWLGPSGIGIFDITVEDVEYIFENFVKLKDAPQTELDYDYIRKVIPKIQS